MGGSHSSQQTSLGHLLGAALERLFASARTRWAAERAETERAAQEAANLEALEAAAEAGAQNEPSPRPSVGSGSSGDASISPGKHGGGQVPTQNRMGETAESGPAVPGGGSGLRRSTTWARASFRDVVMEGVPRSRTGSLSGAGPVQASRLGPGGAGVEQQAPVPSAVAEEGDHMGQVMHEVMEEDVHEGPMLLMTTARSGRIGVHRSISSIQRHGSVSGVGPVRESGASAQLLWRKALARRSAMGTEDSATARFVLPPTLDVPDGNTGGETPALHSTHSMRAHSTHPSPAPPGHAVQRHRVRHSLNAALLAASAASPNLGLRVRGAAAPSDAVAAAVAVFNLGASTPQEQGSYETSLLSESAAVTAVLAAGGGGVHSAAPSPGLARASLPHIVNSPARLLSYASALRRTPSMNLKPCTSMGGTAHAAHNDGLVTLVDYDPWAAASGALLVDGETEEDVAARTSRLRRVAAQNSRGRAQQARAPKAAVLATTFAHHLQHAVEARYDPHAVRYHALLTRYVLRDPRLVGVSLFFLQVGAWGCCMVMCDAVQPVACWVCV